MALIKAKEGNTVYTWKSDDIRDTEITTITNKLNSYGNVELIGGSTLSSADSNGNISIQLEKAFTDYRYILISESYYPNGQPSYGHIMLPTGILLNYFGEGYHFPVIVDTANATWHHVHFYYADTYEFRVSLTDQGYLGNWVVVFGIK